MSIKPIFSFLLLLSLYLGAGAQTPAKAEEVHPVLVGSLLPPATLTDAMGTPVNVQDLVRKKPTVMVFYRGGWCPYCNRQLAGLGKIEADIVKAGYQIMAISPDQAPQAKSTQDKNALPYGLYADPSGELIQKMGIAYTMPKGTAEYIQKQNQQAASVLPVPAVFVLNTEGRIVFEYVNPNYKERLPEKMLLAVLQSLSEK